MEIREINIELIDDPERPARTEIDSEKIADLAESIKSIGLRNPLSVRSVGERFEVEAGHRRLMACRLIGLEVVPCIVDNGDEAMARVVMSAENLAREELNPVDEARLLVELHEKHGVELRELAKKVGVGPAVIRRRMNIERYPECLKKALAGGMIGRVAAEYLSQIDDIEALKLYCSYAVEGGVSVSVARQWVSDYRKSVAQKVDPLEGGGLVSVMTSYEPTYTSCGLCGGPEDVSVVNYIKVCRSCMKRLKKIGEEE